MARLPYFRTDVARRLDVRLVFPIFERVQKMTACPRPGISEPQTAEV